MPRFLLTSSAGSPEDSRTWSGTPSRLLAAFRAGQSLEPIPWSSAVSGRPLRLARACDRLLGLGHSFIHGPARRHLAARGVLNEASRTDCRAILHLGTYDVPLTSSRLPSYLYVDNSYDVWERHASAARQLSSHQQRWFRRLERAALARVRHVFTVGQHVADNFVEAFGMPRARVSAVGSGLGSIQPYYGPKDYATGHLLIVAKVRPDEKGLPLLLKAFALVRQQRPGLRLTVVGGAGNPSLQGVEGVTGTGWITADELQQIFNDSSLFVMPATYEPWGLSYLEALACRTPIVGLTRNAVPEISGSGRYGFMLDQADTDALARLILDALADPARLARMGQEGQRHCVGHYRWERIATTMASIMDQSTTMPT